MVYGGGNVRLMIVANVLRDDKGIHICLFFNPAVLLDVVRT